ncbi:hypothetical protein DFH11DRAFT_1539936 [Phellopilus nigrolimitatus]|nr:hypothetical protein DFH11DRAFT_1539936 [Phellopilus nigrolimitatus]
MNLQNETHRGQPRKRGKTAPRKGERPSKYKIRDIVIRGSRRSTTLGHSEIVNYSYILQGSESDKEYIHRGHQALMTGTTNKTTRGRQAKSSGWNLSEAEQLEAVAAHGTAIRGNRPVRGHRFASVGRERRAASAQSTFAQTSSGVAGVLRKDPAQQARRESRFRRRRDWIGAAAWNGGDGDGTLGVIAGRGGRRSMGGGKGAGYIGGAACGAGGGVFVTRYAFTVDEKAYQSLPEVRDRTAAPPLRALQPAPASACPVRGLTESVAAVHTQLAGMYAGCDLEAMEAGLV